MYPPPPGSNEVLRTPLAGTPGVEVIVSDVVIPPNGQVARHYHPGEEFLYLLSGAVTVWVGDDECYALDREGDALTFPSTLPHRWRNDAGGESRLLWINTPPTF